MARDPIDYHRPSPFYIRILRGTVLPPIRMLWRPEIVNPENYPKGPCFVYGNHANYLDPFIMNLWSGMNPTAGVMAREYVKRGIPGFFMRKIGMLAASRGDPGVIRSIYKLLEDERAIVIYPEGARRWCGLPLPWIESTVRLFVKAGVPVHPVRTHGSYASWPRWAKYPRRARLKVEFLPPITFNRRDDVGEASRLLQSFMDFDENEADPAVMPVRAYRPAVGIENLIYRNPINGVANDLYTVDGTHVLSRSSDLKWKMTPDSWLHDETTGERFSTSQLYLKVRGLSLDPGSNMDVTNEVETWFAADYPNYESLGNGSARLLPDHVELTTSSGTSRIGFDELLSFRLDQSRSLQLITKEGTTRLRFAPGGSALLWSDFLQASNVPTA